MTRSDTAILRDASARLDHQAERIEYLERRLKERDQDAKTYHSAGIALLGIVQGKKLTAEEEEIYAALRDKLLGAPMRTVG